MPVLVRRPTNTKVKKQSLESTSSPAKQARLRTSKKDDRVAIKQEASAIPVTKAKAPKTKETPGSSSLLDLSVNIVLPCSTSASCSETEVDSAGETKARRTKR